jgi:hypothetical protein
VLRIARGLLWIETAIWVVLGVLLIIAALIVLGGGGGIAGIMHVDAPGFAPGLSAWALGIGITAVTVAAWGLWTALALRRRTRRALIGARIYCCVWIVVGLIWIGIATTPVPGTVTLVVNAVMLVGFAVPGSARPTSPPFTRSR